MTEKQKKRKMHGHAKMYLHEEFKRSGNVLYRALPFTEQMKLCEILLKRYNPIKLSTLNRIKIMEEELEVFHEAELQSQTPDWTIPVYAQD